MGPATAKQCVPANDRGNRCPKVFSRCPGRAGRRREDVVDPPDVADVLDAHVTGGRHPGEVDNRGRVFGLAGQAFGSVSVFRAVTSLISTAPWTSRPRALTPVAPAPSARIRSTCRLAALISA